MKNTKSVRFVVFVCAGFILLSAYPAMTKAQSSKNKINDETQIGNVLVSFAAAWNAHDMNKFAELFTPDADWVNIRGSRWKGVEEIRKNHVEIHNRFYSKSRLEFVETSVRMITKDVAVIHAKEIISGSDVPKQAGISDESQMSLIVVRRDGKWLIASGQNTNVAPPSKNVSESNKIKCAENDFDCFSRAAANCQKAEFVFTDSANMGDFTITKSDYYEIKEGNAQECRVYLKNLRWDSAPEKYTDERMKNTVGKDGICKFTSEKLFALLDRWKNGRFSTEDFRGFGCKGTYFSPENGFRDGF